MHMQREYENDTETTESTTVYYSSNEDSDDSSHSDTDEDENIQELTIDEYDICDDIFEYEELLPYTECLHGKYYIGSSKYIKRENILLLTKKINIRTFLKYNSNDIQKYFYWYSGIYIAPNPSIHIIKVDIQSDGVYTCILKTFWIKIIQRLWKKTYRNQQQYISSMKTLQNIRMNELGKRPNIGAYPSLRGMLSHYNTEYI